MAESNRDITYVIKARDEASAKFAKVQRSAVEAYDLKPNGRVEATSDIYAMKPEAVRARRSAMEQDVRDAMADQIRTMRNEARRSNALSEARLRMFGVDATSRETLVSEGRKMGKAVGELGIFAGIKDSLGKGSVLGQTMAVMRGAGAVAGIVGAVNSLGNLASAQRQYLKELETGLDVAEAKMNRMEKLVPMGLGTTGRSIGEHINDSMMDAVSGIGEDGKWQIKKSEFFLNIFGMGDADKRAIARSAEDAVDAYAEAAVKSLKDAQVKIVDLTQQSQDRQAGYGETGMAGELAAVNRDMDKEYKKLADAQKARFDSGIMMTPEDLQADLKAIETLDMERAKKIQDVVGKYTEENMNKLGEDFEKAKDAEAGAMGSLVNFFDGMERDFAEIAESNAMIPVRAALDDFFAFQEGKPMASRGPGSVSASESRSGVGILAASAEGMAIKSGAATAKNTERTAKAVEALVAAAQGGSLQYLSI